MKSPIIVVLTKSGLATAQQLLSDLPDAQIHGHGALGTDCDVGFEGTADYFRKLFEAKHPVIGICAAGILVRSLAQCLKDKWNEPPVIAVAEDGSAVVPLLGGHHGGNELARQIATILQVDAAITTAGDIGLGLALDEPPRGYRLANPQDAKSFAAQLLGGAKVELRGQLPWASAAKLNFSETAELQIYCGIEEQELGPKLLAYHPAQLAVGVGCERGCAPEELAELVEKMLNAHGFSAHAVGVVVTLDLKEDEPAMAQLAEGLGVPLRVFKAEVLEAEAPRLQSPSDVVFEEVGCHGVSEGAALAAVGKSGKLVVAKTKSAHATCAIAVSPDLLDTDNIGRARGHLAVVGLGPGATEWRTPEVSHLLEQATDLVGYDYYLDLIGPLRKGQIRHDFPLGEETKRVDHALGLAAEGREVALVSSGDPGIYAMAALVFEQIEASSEPAIKRVKTTIAPGISALQAASARAGAPLGHDFCAISLSDLLTPREVIKKRLNAAATGDFVVAFYNPASLRRKTLLPKAKEIFLTHRPAKTPVILGRHLGREDETVTVTTLAEFDPETVDMMTIVIFGASSTRAIARGDGSHPHIYTPRGYGLPVGDNSQMGEKK